MDRKKFFDNIRSAPFPGSLNASQVQGITAILDEWDKRKWTDIRELAYMLGTAFHETAKRMQAVRETLADTDDAAIRILDRSFAAGKLTWVKTPYWRKDTKGKSWLGRGLVQLTHKANYAEMSDVTGIDLVANPGRAMELPVAIQIMFEGMRRGAFTGHKLERYFPDGGAADWTGARKIINGTESDDIVADHARRFHAALVAAG